MKYSAVYAENTICVAAQKFEQLFGEIASPSDLNLTILLPAKNLRGRYLTIFRGRAAARGVATRARRGAIAEPWLFGQLAEIEGPDRKKWLTGRLRNVLMIPMMCCATSGSNNWLRKSMPPDEVLFPRPDGVSAPYSLEQVLKYLLNLV